LFYSAPAWHSGQVSPIESKHVPHRGYRLLRRNAGRWISTGDGNGALARMRVGAILYPAVFLAFADGACFLQGRDRPAAQRADRVSFFYRRHQGSSCQEESLRLGSGSALATQSRDSAKETRRVVRRVSECWCVDHELWIFTTVDAAVAATPVSQTPRETGGIACLPGAAQCATEVVGKRDRLFVGVLTLQLPQVDEQ
jgi:hypothetical protein